MQKIILLIESSAIKAKAITDQIDSKTSFSVIWLSRISDVRQYAPDNDQELIAVIANCVMPESDNAEALQFGIDLNVPVLALVSDKDLELLDVIRKKNIFELILSNAPNYCEAITNSLESLLWHRQVEVLVVDNNPTFCRTMASMLDRQFYQVFEASSGRQALAILRKHPGIKVMVTDLNMPKMDGFSLTWKVRKQYSSEELAIIGISGVEDRYVAARFMEYGANDFICKNSFCRTEFIFRVNRCTAQQEYIRRLNDSIIKDKATGLLSRKYFYEYGDRMMREALGGALSCAVFEIDYQDMLIAGFGQDIMELAQKHVTGFIAANLSEKDIMASFQGNRIAVLMETSNTQKVYDTLEKLRISIAKSSFNSVSNETIEVTISVGCAIGSAMPFASLVDHAAKNLSEVKKADGNGVYVKQINGEFFCSDHLPIPEMTTQMSDRNTSSHKTFINGVKNILLVDDSRVIRKIVSGYLRELGEFNCQEAKNGKEGLEKLQTGNFDLVFFDIAMPIMNGIKAATIARSEFPDLLIVMLTAESDLSCKANEIGVNDYITKPFDKDKISNCLARLGW